MQLTRYTDYALRVLSYLALLPPKQLATIDELSAVYDLKKNHVSKIIHRLAKAKLIETRRGKGGGFYLLPASLSRQLGDLIILLEGEAPLVECAEPACVIQSHCQLKHLLAAAKVEFVAYLNRYQLIDLVNPSRPELIALLTLPETT